MTPHNLPATIADETALDELLSEPSPTSIQSLAEIPGDVIVLGAGGKMGPTLVRMIRRASEIAGTDRRVIAVSRFSNPKRNQSWSNRESTPLLAICLIRIPSQRCPMRQMCSVWRPQNSARQTIPIFPGQSMSMCQR